MRLWTLHPKYLDAKGLVAAWREALLAQAVLRDRNDWLPKPSSTDPVPPLTLTGSKYRVLSSRAACRGKPAWVSVRPRKDRLPRGGRSRLKATLGQLGYEWKHLRAKLAIRDKAWLASLGRVARPDAHPTFRVVPGDVEDWEVGGRLRRTANAGTVAGGDR